MRPFTRSRGTTFWHHFVFVVLNLIASVSLVSSTYQSASTETRHKPKVQQKQKNDRCKRRCSPPGDQLIYIPLIELPEARGGEIVFNSRSPEAMEVTPVFYKRNGDSVIGDPVQIQSAEIRYVNIEDLLPKRHRHENNWGGFALSYHGANRQMWSQFRFLGVNGGVNVDEFFTVKAESRSPLYEAAWWVPANSESIIALGNITDTPTSATVVFTNGQTRTVNLRPHATELVRKEHQSLGTESVRIEVTGAAGSIVPTGIITAKNGSFNSVIRFYSPSLTRQPHLFANGFRVANVTPHMVLKNTSSSSVILQPEFLPVSGRGTAGTLVWPQINLEPNEVIEVDLSALKSAATSRYGFDTVSIQIANNGEPGSVIGSLYGIDDRTGMSYDLPLRDSGPLRAMTGSYPWKITDDFSTMVYVTNITDQEAQFITEINYPGGKLNFEPRILSPGETAVFDLEQIRDEKRQDLAGNHLPANVLQGQFKWAVRGVTNGKIVLIGRAEMVSKSSNISTSYSCNDPCPPYYGGSIDPFPPPIVVNGSAEATVWEIAYYDSGYMSGPYATTATWSLYDPIASINPTFAHSTTATGAASGGTTLHGFIAMQQDYGWDGLNCYEYGYYEESVDTPIEVTPRIDNITPGLGSIDSAVGISITGSGFGNSPTVNVGGGGITANVQSSSETSISVTLNIAANASAGNHGITVTANGQQSNSVNFFVQVPTKLQRNSISNLQNEGGCGAVRNLSYILLDQNGDPISTNGTVSEGISNFNGPAGVQPPPQTQRTMAQGTFQDVVGYNIATCPPPFTATFVQSFTVHLNTAGHAWALSSQNSVSMGRTSAGAKFVDINFTQ